ncbi:sigma-54 interaction domain-containing protein [Nitrospina watsonii]|uniref:PAS modulated sigma54 specific transcriptional regulator, Fis family n=1 Tax=Nitrospina watsonii TaxID=1323948 RepID=A0ABM9HBY0_9BACT|nr:sigma 54-interacting transcriptional regulator [Nitrospina watsonii]CAI2717668.1 PAS modulated sigma54 specific transcriptional regulator, Fis family [Nitrospina watsonii]
MNFNLNQVLDSARDGIFIVARDHRLVLFNHACEELYNVSREDVIDKACWKLSDFEKSWNEAARSGGRVTYGELGAKKERMILPHKSGKQVWVETIYTPIFDEQKNEIAYVMGVIKDITELKVMEQEKERLQQEIGKMRGELGSQYDFSSIVGRSGPIMQVLKLAAEVAQENTTVMLVGESGTGKELVAKAIHYNSHRAGKPFVALNCSAFPETLIESELFGYEKGAFTGAEKSKPGKIQIASGGTLFLDEVTEMTPATQAKILRVIQEREFEPLGSVKPQQADIRIVAASNKDLEPLVKKGLFREDLFYRLFVYPIAIPPLRERPEDLEPLIEHLLTKFNHQMAKRIQGIAPAAMEILKNYDWPGNVRELQNVMERLMILSKGEAIQVDDLPRYVVETMKLHTNSGHDSNDRIPAGFSLERTVDQFESRIIRQALKQCEANKSRAANLLGLSRSTFRYKVSRLKNYLNQS